MNHDDDFLYVSLCMNPNGDHHKKRNTFQVWPHKTGDIDLINSTQLK